MSKENSFALYVHLPFCARKCPYCAFASSEIKSPHQVDEVIAALIQEGSLRSRHSPWSGMAVHSLFLGGGTPSTLTGTQILDLVSALRNTFTIADDAEVTIEVNPGTVTDEKMNGWHDAGINRISLGVQSLDPDTLGTLGRIHSADQARMAFKRMRKFPFAQVSVDLMYGVVAPDPLDGWRRTLEEVISWRPDHLSAYSLIVEEDTTFHRLQEQGINVKCTEEEELAQYELARTLLAKAGFEHYEVSNWALTGHACRHNISYWDGGSYLALGPSGHSYDATRQRRFWNSGNTQEWLGAVLREGVGEEGGEVLTPMQYFEERLMLGLRMVAGVEEKELQTAAKRGQIAWPPAALTGLIKRGLIERQDGILRYTRSGILIADEIEAILTS
ncbi:MAG: radical SAM family heme chaperone HemW [bacterium]